ncbi:uracil-DNA glycosylase family protein [Flammeovirga kamogawensis]|uniref:Uracil-DNA glycosylase family protein n=1 Tax=Flammeovirga kamogawensis TaxID=373891 RepID=A0ABX8GZS1_9BACT|nr:uracil-DNA glycosylase family protein [Flammeovirga kamogawensis]MBB6459509.1 uracil-DNA glycosylase family 4 [Flammeovirga kamogawensis]QWG09060.1 uracil-DNA glycosylase family protein [Flammeovirga kamogawensis]TRX67349.1 uracil-DNA glycosylase family protein [Flammeovirga kamogawensis]
MDTLTQEIKKCEICVGKIPNPPHPVFSFHPKCKIIIVGQAPGAVVDRTGIPWDDKSGENLRKWMGVTNEEFYDKETIAILPMGFCFPGTGKSGDLPPRKECAPKWHTEILPLLTNVELILLVGKYAQDYYLKGISKKNLTVTVKNYAEYLPKFFVLPHPSPRNNIWMKKNAWFKEDVLPTFKVLIKSILQK